jgi:uncharacterized protein (DUF1810 family)
MTYDLQRFVDAQRPIYDQVCLELRNGKKRSHWMWFIFPQLRGLGHSPMAQHFAIADKTHADAYLMHPILGKRLRDCAQLVNCHAGLTAADIFGYPDCLKLHSSMTLFHEASSQEQVFTQALRQFYDGKLDQATLQRLQGQTLRNPAS